MRCAVPASTYIDSASPRHWTVALARFWELNCRCGRSVIWKLPCIFHGESFSPGGKECDCDVIGLCYEQVDARVRGFEATYLK